MVQNSMKKSAFIWAI